MIFEAVDQCRRRCCQPTATIQRCLRDISHTRQRISIVIISHTLVVSIKWLLLSFYLLLHCQIQQKSGDFSHNRKCNRKERTKVETARKSNFDDAEKKWNYYASVEWRTEKKSKIYMSKTVPVMMAMRIWNAFNTHIHAKWRSSSCDGRRKNNM